MALERHGLRWVQPALLLRAPAARTGARRSWPRSLDETAASLDALAAGRRRALARVRGARTSSASAPLRARCFAASRRCAARRSCWPRSGPRGMRRLRAAAAHARPTGSAASSSARSGARAWLYGSAMHGDVPPRARGQRDRRRLPQPPRPRRRLAEPGGRRRAAGRRARRPPARSSAARCARARASRGCASHGGRARGVELDGGEAFAAPLVVADVVPRALLALARRRAPAALRGRRCARFRHGPATVKVDWALSGRSRGRRRTRARRAPSTSAGTSTELLDGLALGATAAWPSTRSCSSASRSSPTRRARPAGKHTAWAYTHGPRGVDWERRAPRFAERIEAQVERFAPGFRDRILARHVLSPGRPRAARREPRRRRRRRAAATRSTSSSSARCRPSAPYRTPVRGLYLGSASTFPGGAVHGVPGHAAARVALLESRLPH